MMERLLQWLERRRAAHEMLHQFAKYELEIVLGSDRILRVNIDGACTMRVAMLEGCILTERNYLAPAQPSASDVDPRPPSA